MGFWGFLGQISGFLGYLGYLSQDFGDFWIGFGTFGSCLGWDPLGLGSPNPTQNPRFWVQMYGNNQKNVPVYKITVLFDSNFHYAFHTQ